MDELQEAYARASELFGQKVRAIGEGQWGNATPCTEWDVRALVNHLVYENAWVPELFSGATVAEVGDRFEGDLLGDDPLGAWNRSATAALGAVAAEGAMDRKVDTSMGPITGRTYTEQLFADLVIHGWDLARGIDADDTIEPGFVASLYAEMAPKEQEMKGWGLYGDTVAPPTDADLQTKLLAITGRVA